MHIFLQIIKKIGDVKVYFYGIKTLIFDVSGDEYGFYKKIKILLVFINIFL